MRLLSTANKTSVETPEQFFDYNFGYDVVMDSVNHIRHVNPTFKVPETFFQNEPGRGVFPKEIKSETCPGAEQRGRDEKNTPSVAQTEVESPIV